MALVSGTQSERVLELVAALNRGADDDEHWLCALDQLSAAFHGAALLIGSTHRDGGRFELSGHQIDLHWMELVNGPLAGHDANPIFATVSRLLRDSPGDSAMKPLRLSDWIDPDDYRASPIYRQAIAPAGFEHAMVVVLDALPTTAISLTLVRSARQGDFSERDSALAAAIGPHLLSAMRLRTRFAIARSTALLLDCIDRPTLLLDQDGALLHANREGEKLLASGDGLGFHHGRLTGATVEASRALAHAIGECGRAAKGASLAPTGVVRVRRPSGLPDLVIRAMPIAASASIAGGGTAAAVALIIHDPAHQSQTTLELIASGLGISKAEAAVAERMWEGDGVVEAAQSLGLSPNTIKSHLKTVYEITGVHRQSSLVRRIALLLSDLGPSKPSPINDPH